MRPESRTHPATATPSSSTIPLPWGVSRSPTWTSAPVASRIPITILAATLEVPYQRLRRLEIGIRADPELEQRAATALDQISTRSAA